MKIYPVFNFKKREFYLILDRGDQTYISRNFGFQDRSVVKGEDTVQLKLTTHGIEFIFEFKHNDKSDGVCMPYTIKELYRDLIYLTDMKFSVNSCYDMRLYIMKPEMKEITKYYELEQVFRDHNVILD